MSNAGSGSSRARRGWWVFLVCISKWATFACSSAALLNHVHSPPGSTSFSHNSHGNMHHSTRLQGLSGGRKMLPDYICQPIDREHPPPHKKAFSVEAEEDLVGGYGVPRRGLHGRHHALHLGA